MHINQSGSHTGLRITRDTEKHAGVNRALPCQRARQVISEEDGSSQWSQEGYKTWIQVRNMDCSVR